MAAYKSNLTSLLMLVLAGAASGLLIRMVLLPGEGCHAPSGTHEHSKAAPMTVADDEEIAYRVGNANCPIMGGAVNPDAPPVVVHGLAIGICCPGCDVQIREDVPGTLRKLLREPKSGAALGKWLDANPEVKRAAGLMEEGAAEQGHPGRARAPAGGKHVTPVLNEKCPIDGKPADRAHTAQVSGVALAACSSGCRERIEAGPEAALHSASRDPVAAARIEASRNLSQRGGHGPHFECPTCKVRSGAAGPCPDCGAPLVRAVGEPVYKLANGRCPIMGEEIPADAGTSFIHDGVEVRICCASCEETFKQHPDYYLAKIAREQKIVVPRLVPAGAGR